MINKTLMFSLALLFLNACGEESDSSVGASERQVSTGTEIPNVEVCDQEYSMCGFLSLPDSFSAEPRELLITLFSNLPPQGPPDAVLMRVDTPSVAKGEFYPVRVQPVLESGEYFVYVSLYVEGGGQYQPISQMDYIGQTATKLDFDGEPISFGDIEMNLAE